MKTSQFIEDFALARDRAKVLAQLIPGTQEHYFYSCLQAQHTGDFATVGQLLDKWIERHGYTDQVEEIRNRQALLEYERHPKRSLEHIRETLRLHFSHQREQDAAGAAVPTAFDPSVIGVPELTRQALSRYENLEGFEDAGLVLLDPRSLDPTQRSDLLRRLTRPDFPDLARLVVDDLKYEHTDDFGAYDIHRQLLRSQLDTCIRLKPDLLDDENFVFTYLVKLAPDDDTDIRENPDERLRCLERLWSFVKPLNPVHNSLKAHVLYHLLALHRARGQYDADLFMAYVKLPRQAHYVAPEYLDRKKLRHVRADLSADFSGVTGFATVDDDTPLVEDYLALFFRTARDYKAYTPTSGRNGSNASSPPPKFSTAPATWSSGTP